MGTSGYSSSVTSSIVSGAGLDDILAQPPITTHLKLIELSEALAAHNASAAAALRLANQEPVAGVALHPPPLPVSSRGSEADASGNRERRKSSATSRYLISGPLPPPPPPPPPSALITQLPRREHLICAMQNPAITHIRLPAFWPDQVQLWFTACEAQFAVHGIHNQHARYSCVLALLKPEDLSLLSDLILNPDPTRPYDRLKAGIIQRSRTAQWRSARNEVPSAIVHRIRHTLYEKAVHADEAAMKEMIVPFLPPAVRSVLEPVKETASLDQLAQMADRVMAMKIEGEALEAAFGEMVSQQQRQTWRQRSDRFRRRSTSRRPRAPPQRLLLCEYHQRFGEQAKNCRPPCDYHTREQKIRS
ncbi:unnamed protein product [Taenia asiatica]|uniref:DUF7041 domain-containing protein n=1 Tax=Taenia asiatica TaxID=60517 RepID=A0A0R3W317_TAEAS|nr:unnamed protein product [Taenia asiatica]